MLLYTRIQHLTPTEWLPTVAKDLVVPSIEYGCPRKAAAPTPFGQKCLFSTCGRILACSGDTLDMSILEPGACLGGEFEV